MICWKIVVRCVAASGAILLASCGSQSDSGEFMTWDQANQEYQEAVASFPWALPEGVDFPSSPFHASGNMLYQRGWGAMQAYIFAECAYQRVVVDNEYTSMEAAMDALDKAERIHGSPTYQSHYSDPDGIWQGVIDKARLGDFSEFNAFFSTDCST